MTERKRIYRDSYGIRRTLIWDDDDPDSFTIHTEEDLEPLLDSIARDRDLMPNDGVNKVLGRVPVTTWERACREQWDESDWQKWWNFGEGWDLRIYRGRV